MKSFIMNKNHKKHHYSFDQEFCNQIRSSGEKLSSNKNEAVQRLKVLEIMVEK